MKFAIITHVPHIAERKNYLAYAPYVSEIDLWSKHIEELTVVAPFVKSEKGPVDKAYEHQNIKFIPIERFDILSLKGFLIAVLKIPVISWQIFKAMQNADHIHLRCPGNIGLLGALIQIAFPNKPKTAKYAGNWDPQSKQPLTYKMQKWILSNTFLTRNMQVMVYGEWPNQTKNIKPFFTATYSEEDKLQFVAKDFNSKIQFVFVGTLVKGKNPLYAIQLTEALIKKGHQVALSLYGEGVERESLLEYIYKNNLESNIMLKGNQNKEVIKNAYQESHFVILASESEGWPKAIAEGMFWGCVPLATGVSFLPFMLDDGKRGVLLDMDLENDVKKTEMLLNDRTDFNAKSVNASDWSRNYTLDVFERAIIAILKQDSKFNN